MVTGRRKPISVVCVSACPALVLCPRVFVLSGVLAARGRMDGPARHGAGVGSGGLEDKGGIGVSPSILTPQTWGCSNGFRGSMENPLWFYFIYTRSQFAMQLTSGARYHKWNSLESLVHHYLRRDSAEK